MRAFICKAHKSYYKIDSRDVDFLILLRICLFKILDEYRMIKITYYCRYIF